MFGFVCTGHRKRVVRPTDTRQGGTGALTREKRTTHGHMGTPNNRVITGIACVAYCSLLQCLAKGFTEYPAQQVVAPLPFKFVWFALCPRFLSQRCFIHFGRGWVEILRILRLIALVAAVGKGSRLPKHCRHATKEFPGEATAFEWYSTFWFGWSGMPR